jgi:hypothetical protein
VSNSGRLPNGTGLSQQAVEPVPVSPLRASIPSAKSPLVMCLLISVQGIICGLAIGNALLCNGSLSAVWFHLLLLHVCTLIAAHPLEWRK